MTRIALLLSLIASFALAQPAVTRGGALKKRAFQTYATATYYMDPTGSDSGSCTSTGTGACLTLQGIWNKVPHLVRHNITVNVAAGSYTSTSRLEGIEWGSVATSGVAGATISVVGPALTNFTPATGTATGTTTTITSNVGNVPLPVFTDSGQSWTVNDLRGYFLVMTSGAQSGLSQPIVSNTATTITTMSWSTIPVVGSTYAIQTPDAVITGDQSFTGFRGAGGSLRFTNLTFTSASASNTLTAQDHAGTPAGLLLFACRVLKTSGTANVISSQRAPSWQGSTGRAAVLHTGTGIAVLCTDCTSAPSGVLAVSNSVAVVVRAVIYRPNYFSPVFVAVTTGAASTAAQLLGVNSQTAGVTTNSMTLICPAGSTGVGLDWAGSGAARGISVENCGTGIRININGLVVVENISRPLLKLSTSILCRGTTTCVSVARGGAVDFLGTIPTFTGVTNELQLDGENFDFSTLSGLPTPQVISNSYGSTFIR